MTVEVAAAHPQDSPVFPTYWDLLGWFILQRYR